MHPAFAMVAVLWLGVTAGAAAAATLDTVSDDDKVPDAAAAAAEPEHPKAQPTILSSAPVFTSAVPQAGPPRNPTDGAAGAALSPLGLPESGIPTGTVQLLLTAPPTRDDDD
jgi:hypothetical protein